jgi:enediyne biosynthesis protein E4
LLLGRLLMQAGRHAEAEPLLALVEVCRGAAFGGIDNDGAMDSVVANNNGPTRLLRNTAGTGRHWLTVQLRDTQSHRMGAIDPERTYRIFA